MSFSNMTLDMDFIDHACMTSSTKEGFSLGNASTSPFQKSKSNNRNPATTDRDTTTTTTTTTIDSLRKELAKSKMREKKLIQEFTDKIKELHQASPAAFQIVESTNHHASFHHGEDMPMDEMADTARMERTVRTLEQMEQKRALEEFQKNMERQMVELRRSNAEQLEKMERKLVEKEEENEFLRKKVETVEIERNYYKEQGEEMCSSYGGDKVVLEGRNDLTPLQRLRYDRLKRGDYTPQTCETNTTFDSISAEIGGGTVGGTSPGPPSSRLDSLFQSVTDPSLNSMYELLKVVESVVSSEESDDCKSQEILETLSDSEQEFVERIKQIFDHSHREHVQVIESLKMELEETYNVLKEDDVEVTTMLEEKQNKIRDLELELSSARESARNHTALENMLRMVAEEQKSSLVQFQELKKKFKILEKERDALVREKQQYVAENENAKLALGRVVKRVDSVDGDCGLVELVAKVEKLSRGNLISKRNFESSNDPLSMNESEVTIGKDEYERLCQATEQLEELERENQVAKGVREQVHSLEMELKSAQQTIEELHQEIATNEKLNIEHKEMSKENKDLRVRVTELEDVREEFNKFKSEHEKMQNEIENLRNILQKCQEENEKLFLDLESKKHLQELVSSLESEIHNLGQQAKDAEEAIRTAKEAHAREEKLEKELSNAMSMLDKINAEKKIVEANLRSQSQSMMTECNDLESKLQALQEEVIDMKEERLAFKSKVRETEIELERTRRIMSLMQETSNVEGTASQAIMDLKEQLREKQELLSRLRHCCEPGASFMIDDIEAKVHMTLCLLETNVLSINGSKSITPFDFSGSVTPKEQLLERSLRIQRAENDRIQKEMEELKIEKDQEASILQVELKSLQGKYDLKNDLLAKKELELKTILKEPCVGYISEDESDFEDVDHEMISKNMNNSNSSSGTCKMCEKLRFAKEAAETEAKQKAQSLAEAKMIISSLEQSNKNITENLRTRLHDSNAAIVSLLEQSKLHEKETAEFKKQLRRYAVEKESLKAKLAKPKHENNEDENRGTAIDNEIPTADGEANEALDS
jgi:hypothetical protein